MFSSTVKWGRSVMDWGRKETRRIGGDIWSMRTPSSEIEPAVTGSRPATARKSVVLPAPLGPMIAVTPSDGEVNPTPARTAGWAGKSDVSPSRWS
jgi:hypothetical protein